ncbi:MAG: Rossmann-like and DUF2520 domain-containing protein [Cellulophaga sp.]
MTKVVILGFGNLATHLYRAFTSCEQIQLVQVFNRSIQKIEHLKNEIDITCNLAELKDADIYIISSADDVISLLSNTLNSKDKLVVHTSGSVPLEALSKHKRSGVFYPLQTFSKEKNVAFNAIPICIETKNESDFKLLHLLASEISKEVFRINSEQRKSLHLAAVFVNNFTNHLYHISSEICKDNDIPFDILRPLLIETAEKTKFLTPKDAQTGPARRNDTATINGHLEQLKTEQQKEIYSILSNAIKSTYTK